MTLAQQTTSGPEAAAVRASLSPWLYWQLLTVLGGILLAAILPASLRFGVMPSVQFWDQSTTALFVSFGVILSSTLLGRLSRYPGYDPISSVFPAVTIGFGLVLLVIVLGHLPYARSLLITGFTLTLVWFSFIVFAKRRWRKPRLAVLPLGSAPCLEGLPNVQWVPLTSPGLNSVLPRIDGIVSDLSAQTPQEWADFMIASAASGMAIYDSVLTRELMTGEVELDHPGKIGLNALLPQRGYLVFKTAIDVLAALVLAPLFLIVIGLTAIAIRAESAGPVFYVQTRVGYRGHQFRCYKLRSMTVDADRSGPSFTSDGDPRVTKVGRFIRKYRIDELPQIFNILKGEMSWIGPRPEAVALATHYARNIPFYAFRHAVKPGITGWAAVRQGNVAEIDAATTKLRNDFFYIKHISPSLDAFIAMKTIWIILTGFGSR